MSERESNADAFRQRRVQFSRQTNSVGGDHHAAVTPVSGGRFGSDATHVTVRTRTAAEDSTKVITWSSDQRLFCQTLVSITAASFTVSFTVSYTVSFTVSFTTCFTVSFTDSYTVSFTVSASGQFVLSHSELIR